MFLQYSVLCGTFPIINGKTQRLASMHTCLEWLVNFAPLDSTYSSHHRVRASSSGRFFFDIKLRSREMFFFAPLKREQPFYRLADSRRVSIYLLKNFKHGIHLVLYCKKKRKKSAWMLGTILLRKMQFKKIRNMLLLLPYADHVGSTWPNAFVCNHSFLLVLKETLNE